MTDAPDPSPDVPAPDVPASDVPASDEPAPVSESTALSAPASADPVESAWAALREHWNDEAKHKAFVALSASFNRLPEAGKRYREASSDPALAERAERGKQLVLGLAMATIETMPRTERGSKAAVVAPFAAFLLLVAANFLSATIMRSRTPLSPWVFLVEFVLVLVIPWKKLQRGD